MNDTAADCDGGLTFHSQLPLRVKNDSLCPPSTLGYYHSPWPMRASPLLQSVSQLYHTLSILGALSHVILALYVLYVRVHYRGIFRFWCFLGCVILFQRFTFGISHIISLVEMKVIQAPIWWTISYWCQLDKFSSLSFPGLWALHPDGNPGSAARGQWNGSRLHFCHPQTPTHDHKWNGQSPDPNMPQLAGLATALWPLHGPAHECHGLRGDGPHLPGVWVGEHGRHKGENRKAEKSAVVGRSSGWSRQKWRTRSISFVKIVVSQQLWTPRIDCAHFSTSPHSPFPLLSATMALELKSLWLTDCLLSNGDMNCSANFKKKKELIKHHRESLMDIVGNLSKKG